MSHTECFLIQIIFITQIVFLNMKLQTLKTIVHFLGGVLFKVMVRFPPGDLPQYRKKAAHIRDLLNVL